MADVSEYVAQIRQAIYGEQVRGSIANAIEAMNTESSQAIADSADAKSSAADSASASALSATEAANSAQAAQTAADNAGDAITAAQAAATSAANSATSASDSATAAKASADSLAQIEADEDTYFASWLQNLSDDFDAWWANVKSTLDTDTALHLQNQIDDLYEKEFNDKYDLVNSNTVISKDNDITTIVETTSDGSATTTIADSDDGKKIETVVDIVDDTRIYRKIVSIVHNEVTGNTTVTSNYTKEVRGS